MLSEVKPTTVLKEDTQLSCVGSAQLLLGTWRHSVLFGGDAALETSAHGGRQVMASAISLLLDHPWGGQIGHRGVMREE